MKIIRICAVLILCAACSRGAGEEVSASDSGRVRAAIYAGEGVGEPPWTPRSYAGILKAAAETINPSITCGLIDAKSIERGDLAQYDVIVFPGGVAGTIFRGLGDKGRRAVKDFVRSGGGYVGICAGAYMGQTREPGSGGGSLAISSAAVYNRGRNWARGAGLIEVEVTPEGSAVFPELRPGGRYIMHYNNGPLMIQLPGMEGSDPMALIRFVSDVHHGAPAGKGESPGKIFLHKSRYGSGRVLLMSGHPEMTPGFKWMLPRMIESAAGRSPAPYPEKFVRPRVYSAPVMFDAVWSRQEASYLAIIRPAASDEPGRVRAPGNLADMGSRSLCYRFPVLLKDSYPPFRAAAARAAVSYDCFAALPAIQAAVKVETEPAALEALKRADRHLSPH